MARTLIAFMQRSSRDWPVEEGDEGGADRGASAVSVGSDIGELCAPVIEWMFGVTLNWIPVWKLAHTRVRCRASQSDASRTSFGTRLWPADCHLRVTSACADSSSSTSRSTLFTGMIGSIRPAEMKTLAPLRSLFSSGSYTSMGR